MNPNSHFIALYRNLSSWQSQLRLAQRLGYTAIRYPHDPSDADIQALSESGLAFYLHPTTCEKDVTGHRGSVDFSRWEGNKTTYSAQEQKIMETYYVRAQHRPFPFSMATGWWRNPTQARMQLNLQAEIKGVRLIDLLVDALVAKAHDIEAQTGCRWAGVQEDVPTIHGDFHLSSDTAITKLSAQTGEGDEPGPDTGWFPPDGPKRVIDTYTEARIEFYRVLHAALRAEPDPPLLHVGHPWQPWREYFDDLIVAGLFHEEIADIKCDLLFAESGGGPEEIPPAMLAHYTVKEARGMSSPGRGPIATYAGSLESVRQCLADGSQFAFYAGAGNVNLTLEELDPWVTLHRAITMWAHRSRQSPVLTLSDDVTVAVHPDTGDTYIAMREPELGIVVEQSGRASLRNGAWEEIHD